MKLKTKEDEWMNKIEEYEKKILTVDKALNVKMNQLIEHLRRDHQIFKYLCFIFEIALF